MTKFFINRPIVAMVISIIMVIIGLVIISMAAGAVTKIYDSAITWEVRQAEIYRSTSDGFVISWSSGEYTDYMRNTQYFVYYTWPEQGPVSFDRISEHDQVAVCTGRNRHGEKVSEHLRFSDDVALLCSHTYYK